MYTYSFSQQNIIFCMKFLKLLYLVNGNESFCSDLPGGEKERMDEIEQDLYGLRPGFILSQVGGSILSQVGGFYPSQVGGSILSQVDGSILFQLGESILF
jgi:hypothetical protein